MLTWWEALVLAVVQGLTEFLPVSSSGHLAFVEKVLNTGLEEHRLAFFVCVHVGTLVAVVAYYRRDLLEMFKFCLAGGERGVQARKLLGLLALGSVPAALVGLLGRGYVEGAFDSLLALGLFWLLTAGMMIGADRLRGQKQLEQTRWTDALWVGAAQALAIFPGVSRSGATIFGGLASGLGEGWAPRFAFLLSVPAILGATAVEALELRHTPLQAGQWPLYVLGAVVSAAVGYVAIGIVLRAVRRARLRYFGYWCVGMGLAALGWALLT